MPTTMAPRTLLAAGSLCCWILVLASCGGSANDDGPGSSGGSTSSGKGGTTGSGGTTGTGGTTGKGGSTSGSGGGVSTGGSGVAGSAGTGGTPDFCTLPPVSGSCNAYFENYYFDSAAGSCQKFVYGGCDGNENRFETLAACEAACGGSNVTACTDNAECMLSVASCCGGCEPAVLSDFVAINVNRQVEWLAMRACTDVLCEPCAEPDPETAAAPYFVATCEAGQCTAVDLRATAATDCETDLDCHLRNGAGCCEGCVADSGIAVSDASAVRDLVCSQVNPGGCLACAPIFPDGYSAVCDNGKCGVDVATP